MASQNTSEEEVDEFQKQFESLKMADLPPDRFEDSVLALLTEGNNTDIKSRRLNSLLFKEVKVLKVQIEALKKKNLQKDQGKKITTNLKCLVCKGNPKIDGDGESFPDKDTLNTHYLTNHSENLAKKFATTNRNR